jgi:SAM-dependent methyltransferase
MTPDQPGLYEDARIYDILHTPGTAQELVGLQRIARRHGHRRRGPWLEPACGTGRLVRLAARRGIPATGFDILPEMIAYAETRIRRAGLDRLAGVCVADMRTFADEGAARPGSIGFAFNTINTFRHLMTDADALAHLGQIRRVLAPGGLYAVGLSTCLYGHEGPIEDVWEARRGTCTVRQTVQYVPPTGPRGGSRVERVFSHLLIERPTGETHRDDAYALRTYSLSQWLDLVSGSGLEWLVTTDHTGRETDPAESGYRLYILRKPG